MMKKSTLIALVVVFLAMILASLMLALMYNPFTVSAKTTIAIDGDFSDWAGVPQYDVAPNPIEPTGDVHGPFNNDLDLVDIYLTDSWWYLYIKYDVAGTMNETAYKYEVFLDIDKNSSTGYRGPDGTWTWGADYMVENSSLYDYDDVGSANQSDWKWNITNGGFARAIGNGNTVEMRIPRGTIGETGYTDDLVFAIRAVNDPKNPTNWDLYPGVLYSFSFGYDNTPPVTTKTVGTPKYDSYVTSSTPITLSVTDPGPCASGVDKTYYRINGGSWIVYTDSFTLTGECSHTIDYYSVDNAGNEETIHSQTLYVDDTAPTTTKTVDPASPDGCKEWYVSVITISLSATDLGPCQSGVAYTEVNLDGSGWVQGTTVIIGEDGVHTLQYRSVDNVGNMENTHTQNYKLDKTKPSITKDDPPDGTYVSGVFTISGSAYDAPDSTSGSGIDYIQINIDGSDVYTYVPLPNPAYGTVPFSYDWDTTGYSDGSGHTITVKAYDDACNSASDVEYVVIDNTSPVTTKTVDPASPDGLDGWYVSVITISLSATDETAGVDYTEVNLDGSGWVQGTTVIIGEDGVHTLQYRSVDKAKAPNVEDTHTQNYKLDKTRPIAAFTHSVSELTINFDASGSTDATSGIDRYEWDFGDGSTGSGVSPSHTYSAAGTYTVTLRVWDKAGNDGTDTAIVAHSVSPVPEFPLGVEAAAGIGLMVAVVYIWLRKRKTKPTVAKRFTTKTQNLDFC